MNIIKLNNNLSFTKAIIPKNIFIKSLNNNIVTLQDVTFFQTISSSSSEKVTIQNIPPLVAQIFRNKL